MTQPERVLRLLKQAGDHGLTQVDLNLPTVDGGPPITRLAARIHDLKNAGVPIEKAGTRQKCDIYRLAPPSTLFDINEETRGIAA